jgi:hypothetical protein
MGMVYLLVTRLTNLIQRSDVGHEVDNHTTCEGSKKLLINIVILLRARKPTRTKDLAGIVRGRKKSHHKLAVEGSR